MSKAITRSAPDPGASSDTAGCLQLGGHLSIVFLAGLAVLAAQGDWLFGPAMLVHGIVLVSLFAGLHETIHRTAFRSRWLNDAVATAIGFVHFLPAGYFRDFHAAHHRFTRDAGRDPELGAPPPASLAAMLLRVSGVPYWRDRIAELASHALGRVTATYVRNRPAVIRDARWHVAGWALIAGTGIGFGWDWLLWLWIVPSILGQPFLRLYLMAEHDGCEMSSDVWRNTRTVRSNALLRFLMWNMPFHTAHHASPGTPFHALPALHRQIAATVQVESGSYTAFHRRRWRQLVT